MHTHPQEEKYFFVTAEFRRNKDIFTKYGKKLQEMPMIILVPPTNKPGSFKWPEEHKYPVSADINAETLAQYFNKYLTGHKVPLPEPIATGYMNYALIVVIVVSMLKNFYQYRYEKNFWMCVCMFLIWFTYTGTIWNINRGPPFILGGKTLSIIYPQQRMQTVLEGLIVASLLLIIGAVFIIIGTYVPRLKKPAEQRYYFYLSSMVFATSFLALYAVWLKKTPWYMVYSQ